jgi:hypothetical protein
VAHPVPEEPGIAVRRVIDGLEPVGSEVSLDRRAVDVEKRPNDPAPAHRDAREATGPGALEDPHEDGLDLVIGGVAERDAGRPGHPRDARQRRVTSEAGGLLGGPATASRHLDPDDTRGAVQPGRQRLDEDGIAVRFRAEPVMDVADREPERVLGAEEDERVQEGDRVGAARDAYEDVVSRIEEPPAGRRLSHGGDQE